MNKRIMKEIENGYTSKEFDFIYDEAGKHGEKNACYLKFTVKNGVYVTQIHILKIKFLHGANQLCTYPVDPPEITFLTPILHANIDGSGGICLDVIKSEMWSPAYGLETIFNSILILLDVPNVDSALNSSAAKSFKENDLKGFKKICQDHYFNKMKSSNILSLMKSPDFTKK